MKNSKWYGPLAVVLSASVLASMAFALDTANLQGRFGSSFIGPSFDNHMRLDRPKCALKKDDDITGYEDYSMLRSPDWLVDDDGGIHADYTNIQSAINAASDGDLIVVCPGEYGEDLVVTKSLEFIGLGSRDEQEIIGHGEISSVNIVTFKDFTFTGGNAAEGGALNSRATLLEIDNSVFDGNTAEGSGGGIYAYAGDVKLESSHFIQNEAEGGGAIAVEQGSLFVNQTDFDENASDFHNGGAVFILNGDLSSSENSYFSNFSESGGGAISCEECFYLNSTEDEFSSNTATVDGGAIYINGDSDRIVSVAVSQADFDSNTSGDDGSAIEGEWMDLIVDESQFTSNFASGKGTIHLLNSMDVYVDSSSFAYNEAEAGPGVISRGESYITILNSTFYQNVNTPGFGGDSLIGGQSSGDINISYSTFKENKADNIAALFWNSGSVPIYLYAVLMEDNMVGTRDMPCSYSGAPVSLGYNSDSSSSCLDGTVTGDMMNTAAMFSGAYGNHGGLTDTLPLNASAPQIDAVKCDASVGEDQRGYARHRIGNICDIGAYEY